MPHKHVGVSLSQPHARLLRQPSARPHLPLGACVPVENGSTEQAPTAVARALYSNAQDDYERVGNDFRFAGRIWGGGGLWGGGGGVSGG